MLYNNGYLSRSNRDNETSPASRRLWPRIFFCTRMYLYPCYAAI